MRYIVALSLVLVMSSFAYAAGETVMYKVGDEDFEGYFVSPSPNAPLVLLIHDWDGLTDYEVKRSEMLAELGYAVFAADMFGAGIRPTETDEKRKLTGALYQDRKRMRSLLQGALETAQSKHGNAPYAVAMGYCFGQCQKLKRAPQFSDFRKFTFLSSLVSSLSICSQVSILLCNLAL